MKVGKRTTKREVTPKFPKGVSKRTPVISKFGFKLIKVQRKYYWEAATEVDFRKAEAKRLDISAKKVLSTCDCAMNSSGGCVGFCGLPCTGFCRKYYNDQYKYYYCACSG